jgi:hypothetical protein
MTGSRAAAERKNGEAGTTGSFLAVACRTALLLALGACSTPAGPPEGAVAARFPASLDGLDSRSLVALLGPPDLRRAEPPAELWQYRMPGCVLDIYLYRDADAFHVVHAETRGRNPAPSGACDGTPPVIRATRL